MPHATFGEVVRAVGSAVAVRFTPTYLFYLLYSTYLFPNRPRTRLKLLQLVSILRYCQSYLPCRIDISYCQFYMARGSSGSIPPPFLFWRDNQNLRSEERGKNYQKTDGPQTDDTTISASTNKMKLVCFYSPAIRLQHQNI